MKGGEGESYFPLLELLDGVGINNEVDRERQEVWKELQRVFTTTRLFYSLFL